MALFTINRYLGEDDEHEKDATDSVDVLTKLKAEALKRKAERELKSELKTKKIKARKSTNQTESVADNEANQDSKPKLPKENLDHEDPEDCIISSVEVSKETKLHSEECAETPEIAKESSEMKIKETEDVPEEEKGEIGGFTVLSAYEKKEKLTVDRVLPEWLSKPSVIAVDLKESKTLISEQVGMDPRLIESLEKNGICYFFPVQRQVIPFLLKSLHPGTLYLEPGFLKPNDICVSAPTGSGKTLAYVVPIVQSLSHRVVCSIRALIVLPVKDLALQVFKVFTTFASALDLKVGLAVSGHLSLVKEQDNLIRKCKTGFYSRVDILVATPGRLVDHLQKTPGFSLHALRFLVIDEADRMMQDVKQDWLEAVEESALRKECVQEDSLTLGGCQKTFKPVHSLQKLLFSATLSQNPEKLELLNLFQPKLFTSVMSSESSEDHGDAAFVQKEGQFIGKYTTPSGLSEYSCSVKNPSLKPLIILYFIAHLKFKQVLVFANTKETTKRLLHLTRGFGDISVKEFSSNLSSVKRERILKQFEQGKVDLIICTDAMARGMDIQGVKWVVSYDCPIYVKTYVHRVGRTARAGRAGSAITLLEENQKDHFSGMMTEASKDLEKMHKVRTDEDDLKPYYDRYEVALQHLKTQIELKASKKGEGKTNDSKDSA